MQFLKRIFNRLLIWLGFKSRILIPAWTKEEEKAFVAYILRHDESEEAHRAACLIWPTVFNTYKESEY